MSSPPDEDPGKKKRKKKPKSKSKRLRSKPKKPPMRYLEVPVSAKDGSDPVALLKRVLEELERKKGIKLKFPLIDPPAMDAATNEQLEAAFIDEVAKPVEGKAPPPPLQPYDPAVDIAKVDAARNRLRTIVSYALAAGWKIVSVLYWLTKQL